MDNSLDRKEEFRGFLLNRNPSEKFAEKYIGYLSSGLIKRHTKELANKENIFLVDFVSCLMNIYHNVKIDANNKRLHNIYSGVISAYIKFLTGRELRKMAEK